MTAARGRLRYGRDALTRAPPRPPPARPVPHEPGLIATVAAAFGLAFVFGFAAARLRLPPLVGYLLAGVVVGPFTPGYVADSGLAAQLAEIGVILLMFGVGLHFSVRDLLAVWRVAVPGALTEIAVLTTLGTTVASVWGWPPGAAVVIGLSLSVASTVVLLRTLEERGTLDTAEGRVAVGWLVVEDLVMVLALVLLPALAPSLGGGPAASAAARVTEGAGVWATLALTLGKVAAFLALMFVVGRRAVPWLLERVARTGSRELFTLAVLAVAMGVAVGAASVFGVSFALGAFAAGVVINESDVSHQAAADALPLQDAFAVLFFVSVGMLFDPGILARAPGSVLTVVLVIAVGKSLAAFWIVLALGRPPRSALAIAPSLGQIGEFSFILAGLGVSLGLLPPEARSLILAGALLSIILNPLVFRGAATVDAWLHTRPALLNALERVSASRTRPAADPSLGAGPADAHAAHASHAAHTAHTAAARGHAVLVGHGRVGAAIAAALAEHGVPYVVVEQDWRTVEALRARGVPAVFGDAARPGILAHAGIDRARLLVVAAPEPYHARQIVALARAANPAVATVVRTHSASELAYLEHTGVTHAVMGEHELARGMVEYALRAVAPPEAG